MRGAFIGMLCGFAVFIMAAVIVWLAFMAEMVMGRGDTVIWFAAVSIFSGAVIGAIMGYRR